MMQIKKAVFTVMMGSEDFQDAAEKLVNLNLNEMQVSGRICNFLWKFV